MTDTGNAPPLTEQAFPKQWSGSPAVFLRGRERVVDRLLYGVFHHPRLQVLSGPDGAGKSIALLRLAERLQGRRTVVVLDAGGISDEQGLLSALCDVLDEDSGPDADTLHSRLLTRLKQLAEQGLPVLLLIDDADALSAESLNALVTLTQAPRDDLQDLLAVVIACGRQMAERLAGDRRYWEVMALNPLSVVGTGRYLRQRLAHAGMYGDGPFDPERVAEIQTESEGWPGGIDVLARDLLGKTADKLRRKPGRLYRYLTTLLLLAVLAGLAWLFRAPLQELASHVPQQLHTLYQSVHQRWPYPAAPASPDVAPAEAPSQTNDAYNSSADDVPSDWESSTAALDSGTPDTLDTSDHQAKPQPAAESPEPATPTVETSIPTKIPVAPEPPLPAPAAATHVAPMQQTRLHDRAWIAAQQPSAWTLQILVAHSLEPLQRLVKELDNSEDFAYWVIHQRGQDWYTLLYGVFADQKTALAAAKTLQPRIDKPWARTYASIHASLGIGR